jgi:hypothetical protein
VTLRSLLLVHTGRAKPTASRDFPAAGHNAHGDGTQRGRVRVAQGVLGVLRISLCSACLGEDLPCPRVDSDGVWWGRTVSKPVRPSEPMPGTCT